MTRVFAKLDGNNNHQIDLAELKDGLKLFSIFLTDEQTEVLMKTFDRDGSGTIDFNEFSSTLRVSDILKPLSKFYLGNIE